MIKREPSSEKIAILDDVHKVFLPAATVKTIRYTIAQRCCPNDIFVELIPSSKCIIVEQLSGFEGVANSHLILMCEEIDDLIEVLKEIKEGVK